MEENVKSVAEQLLDLAQTPEQVQYITNSDSAILNRRIEDLRDLVSNNDREISTMHRINSAKEEVLLKVIKMLAKQKPINNYYD